MKARKIFAIICYTIFIAACAAAGVVSYMAYRQTITYTFGFLLFVPIWIASFWFLTFFTDLSRRRVGGKTEWALKRPVAKTLGAIGNFISVLLLCYWVYVYAFRINTGGTGEGGSGMDDDPFRNGAAVVITDDTGLNASRGIIRTEEISWQIRKN